MPFPRIVVRILASMLVFAAAWPASAQTAKEVPQLLREMDSVLSYVSSHKDTRCTEHCFVIGHFGLTGTLAAMTFEMEGNVNAAHVVAVPLFGAPSKVRIDGVTENGKPASVGFDGDHYFVLTSEKHFVIRGTLTLDSDLALTIPGPVNAFDANLDKGRVLEGSKMSGLLSTTLHFDAGEVKEAVEPTVFQLARAIRVLRETAFEYRLTMRSGNDLGVVRLPLSLGERVLEVSGSAGWKVEGRELVLPTSGRNAQVTITGTLPEGSRSLVPDGRSTYEWWIIESDGEHRLTTNVGPGAPAQVDSAQSPIARTQVSSKLFLAKRGDKLDFSVQTLNALEALAAVVDTHSRNVVLTAKGELVVDEWVRYENNGIDYLMLKPGGKPIYLSTDSEAERIFHRDDDGSEMLIPMRKGTHVARVQSLKSASVGALVGQLVVPMSTQPLTESHSLLTIGLPASVYPLFAFGGDRLYSAYALGDLLAIAFAVGLAWIFLRKLHERLLFAAALGGLWFVSSSLYDTCVVVLVLGGVLRLLWPFLRRKTLGWVRVPLALGGAVLALVLLSVMMSGRSSEHAAPTAALAPPPMDAAPKGGMSNVGSNAEMQEMAQSASQRMIVSKKAPAADGNYNAQRATEGLITGVTPVALPLPTAVRYVSLTRELVTPDRPFFPVLVYASAWLVRALGLLWAVLSLALAWSLRGRVLELLAKARLAFAEASKPDAPQKPSNP